MLSVVTLCLLVSIFSVRHKQTSRSLTKKSKDGEENRVPNSGKKTEDIVVERAELAIQLVTWMMVSTMK